MTTFDLKCMVNVHQCVDYIKRMAPSNGRHWGEEMCEKMICLSSISKCLPSTRTVKLHVALLPLWSVTVQITMVSPIFNVFCISVPESVMNCVVICPESPELSDFEMMSQLGIPWGSPKSVSSVIFDGQFSVGGSLSSRYKNKNAKCMYTERVKKTQWLNGGAF